MLIVYHSLTFLVPLCKYKVKILINTVISAWNVSLSNKNMGDYPQLHLVYFSKKPRDLNTMCHTEHLLFHSSKRCHSHMAVDRYIVHSLYYYLLLLLFSLVIFFAK